MLFRKQSERESVLCQGISLKKRYNFCDGARKRFVVEKFIGRYTSFTDPNQVKFALVSPPGGRLLRILVFDGVASAALTSKTCHTLYYIEMVREDSLQWVSEAYVQIKINTCMAGVQEGQELS
jgi:hypothetical protein